MLRDPSPWPPSCIINIVWFYVLLIREHEAGCALPVWSSQGRPQKDEVGESEQFTGLSRSVYKTEKFMFEGIQIYNLNPSYCNFSFSILVLAQQNRIKSTEHFFFCYYSIFYGSASFIHSGIQESYGETKINEIQT